MKRAKILPRLTIIKSKIFQKSLNVVGVKIILLMNTKMKRALIIFSIIIETQVILLTLHLLGLV